MRDSSLIQSSVNHSGGPLPTSTERLTRSPWVKSLAVALAIVVGVVFGLVGTGVSPVTAAPSPWVDSQFSPAATLNDVVRTTAVVEVNGEEKYIAGGSFTGAGGNDRLAMFNADGSVYDEFNPGNTIANGSVYDVLPLTIDDEQMYVVGGTFTGAGSSSYVALFDDEGGLVNSWGAGTIPNIGVYSLALAELDGVERIMVAGPFVGQQGGRSAILALNKDGTIYEDFHTAYAVNSAVRSVSAVTIDNEVRIILGGNFGNFGQAGNNLIGMVDQFGSVVQSFATGPVLNAQGVVQQVLPIPDGDSFKFMAVGQFTATTAQRNNAIIFNADGSVDTTFTAPAALEDTNYPMTADLISVQNSNKYVLGGQFSINNNGYIALLNEDGTVDPSFAPGNTLNGNVGSVTPVSSASGFRLLVGGSFTNAGEAENDRLAILQGGGDTAPSAPQITAVNSGDSKLTIECQAPQSDGGQPITNYEYQVDGGQWVTLSPVKTACPFDVTGLTNDTLYNIRIRAVNSIGSGAESNLGMGTPRGSNPSAIEKPNKVKSLKVQGGKRASKYKFTWKAPSTAGNRPVETYQLTIQLRGKKPVIINRSLSHNKRSFTISRKALLRATLRTRGEGGKTLTYVAKVRAVNSAGASAAVPRTFKLRT